MDRQALVIPEIVNEDTVEVCGPMNNVGNSETRSLFKQEDVG